MLKKIQQKQNNLYNGTGTDNNQKVINIREKNNSRSKTKNISNKVRFKIKDFIIRYAYIENSLFS